MRVLVLGCGGFIGSHLVERLLSQGAFSVTGVDQSPGKIRHLLGRPGFRFIEGDVYALSRTAKLIRDSDAVISLTALCNPALYNTIPLKVIAANYDLPSRIVGLCAEYKRWLIQFSTCEVYGKTPAALTGSPADDPFVLTEETSHLILGPVSRQRWSYACAKQLLERVIVAHGAESGLSYTIIRPFNFIGPRMDFIPGVDGEGIPRVLACFMQALFQGKPLKLVDGGKARRAFTAIEDAVEALELILRHPEPSRNRIFNIGHPGNEIDIRGLALKMLALYPSVANSPVPPGCVLQEVTAAEFYGPGYDDSDRRIPDISLARNLLGFSPRIGLDDALRRAMAGFVKQYGSAAGLSQTGRDFHA